MNAYVLDVNGARVMHIWKLPSEVLRRYFRKHSLEALEMFWDEYEIGMFGPPASILFDVMREKGGQAIVQQITHRQADFVVSHMAKRPVCIAEFRNG